MVGCDPNPDDFPLNGRVSNERTETEIEVVFKVMGWDYTQMWNYTNGVISLIINFANDVPHIKSKSACSTLEGIQQTNLTPSIK